MQYEIVTLTEKRVAGLRLRANNRNESLGEEIGALWERFYNQAFASIPAQTTGRGIGLYTNYAGGVWEDYDLFVCCEVEPTAALPAGVEATVIPAGRYAKFVLHGDVRSDVAAFWAQLWQMPLERSFTADFEEYVGGQSMEDAEIHIYIALK